MAKQSNVGGSNTENQKQMRALELLRCKMLWVAIFAIVLNVGSFAICLAILFKWVGDLPQTYITNTVQGIVMSLIEIFGVTFITWVSEPSRIGRKYAYLILCACSSVTLIAVWLAGDGAPGAWAFLISRTVLSVVGGGNPQGAPYSVLCAWLTDYVPEHLLTAAFSILLGANFMVTAVIPIAFTGIKKVVGLSDHQLVLIAAVIATVQIPIVWAISPSSEVARTVRPEDPSANSLTAAEDVDNNASVAAPPPPIGMQDVIAALRFIRRERFAVAIIWFCINFYAAADSTNILLFLSKGLDFTELQSNLVLTTMGLAGMVLTCFVVPILSRYVPRSCIVFVGTACSIAHSLVYGLSTSPSVLIGLGFLAAMSFTCIPTLLSYMKVTDTSACTQGALIGTFYGIASVGKAIGPPILAVCLQSYVNHEGLCYLPNVHNFVGAAFCVLAASLLPAVFASFSLLMQECRHREKWSMRNAVSLQQAREQ